MVVSRILIVDDDPMIRPLVARMLAPLGHEVELAPDAETALSSAMERPPALVLTDLKMPRVGGLAFLERLRGAGVDSACMVLSGSDDLEDAFAARQRLNITGFVVKPIQDLNQFLYSVQCTLDRWAIERSQAEKIERLRAENDDLRRRLGERAG